MHDRYEDAIGLRIVDALQKILCHGDRIGLAVAIGQCDFAGRATGNRLDLFHCFAPSRSSPAGASQAARGEIGSQHCCLPARIHRAVCDAMRPMHSPPGASGICPCGAAKHPFSDKDHPVRHAERRDASWRTTPPSGFADWISCSVGSYPSVLVTFCV
jgi:hypothetical protein